jgi:superfamily II DNA or RNA helicase
MEQMVGDIQAILNIIPRQISGKKPSKKEQLTWYEGITVCSIDSRDKVNPKDYGLILLDEADTYLGSDDRREWIGNLSPEYLYALTGTVKINHVDDNVFRLYYWPTTTLKLHHHTPKYEQVYSQFSYILDDIDRFYELKAALYSDPGRNEFIVNTTLAKMAGRKAIVFTEYVEHAHILSLMFQAAGKTVYTLIGEVPKDERERIRQAAKDAEGEVILVGSVDILGRGFDLPELSLAVLTVCEKFESSILQYVGRIIRDFEWKPEPVFVDIVDVNTPVLMNQARTRLRNFNKAFIW